MTFNLNINRSTGEQANINLDIGQILFVLGANGTGKSSLMLRFFQNNTGRVRRISAHRQTWFPSNAMTLSADARRQVETQILNSDNSPVSRWRDDHSSQRSSMAIYDLINAENVRAREIASAVDLKDIPLAERLAEKDAPIKIINELLQLSNLPIEISVIENEQVLASKAGSPPYSIAELSDGERNALLIAADVLTAKPGTLILIDEPERHLHRSIISPLLTLLFAKRPDCAFIVSTHDMGLPLNNSKANTLLIRSHNHTNSTWDFDLISSENEIDDGIKEDILGSRRKVIFVEGAEHSLDKPLYSLIFPNVSVIAKNGCREIENAVTAIKNAPNLHWVHAFGIIDHDDRSADTVAKLKLKNIYALPVYSVEAIYYHPSIQRYVVASRVSSEPDAQALLQIAKDSALNKIKSHADRLGDRRVEKLVKEEIFRNLPNRTDISNGVPISIAIDISGKLQTERSKVHQLIEAGDILSLVSQYPIRETSALSEIAIKLGFDNQNAYENYVRKMLIENIEALSFVKSFFGDLINNVTE